jgi:protein-S-isoprenylcysteine O-methyltransferase Ste14
MIRAELLRLLSWLWAAFGIYWVGSAFLKRSRDHAASGEESGRTLKPTGEPSAYRWLRLSILALTFALLFSRRTAFGGLATRLFPESNYISAFGFGAALLGFAVAIWARIALGRYWSDKVVLQQHHRLIRSGPYAFMRHPIYSGVLLSVAGSAILLGEVRGLLAFCVLLVNYVIKARREERLLERQFDREFLEHRARAGFLLPKLR